MDECERAKRQLGPENRVTEFDRLKAQKDAILAKDTITCPACRQRVPIGKDASRLVDQIMRLRDALANLVDAAVAYDLIGSSHPEPANAESRQISGVLSPRPEDFSSMATNPKADARPRISALRVEPGSNSGQPAVSRPAAGVLNLERAYSTLRAFMHWAIQPDNGYWRCMLCSPREAGAHSRGEVRHRGGCPFIHEDHAPIVDHLRGPLV